MALACTPEEVQAFRVEKEMAALSAQLAEGVVSDTLRRAIIDASAITVIERLGAGAFDEVLRGEYHWMPVAVKRLHRSKVTEAGLRAFKAERRKAPARGVIDGDLVEKFLDLPREKMEQVVGGAVPLTAPRGEGGAAAPVAVTVDDLVQQIEDLVRLH